MAGCGRVGFDVLAAGDGSAPLVDTFGTGPFGPATLITGPNSALDDDDPTLSSDLLELIFDSQQAGANGTLHVSRRASLTAPWSSPTEITEVYAPGDDDTPNLSADGLTLTFSSTRAGGGGGGDDLWMTTRATTASPWSTPVALTELNTSANDQDFSMTSDGLTATFTKSGVLHQTSRASRTAAWNVPSPIDELDASGTEEDPMLSPDGLRLAFSRNSGDYNLFVTTRPSRSAAFATPVRLTELEIPGEDETDPWLSADGHTLVFTRGSTTDRDLYITTR